MWKSFKNYLIVVGIRSNEFTYSIDELIANKKWFKTCFNDRISPYYALTMMMHDKKEAY